MDGSFLGTAEEFPGVPSTQEWREDFLPTQNAPAKPRNGYITPHTSFTVASDETEIDGFDLCLQESQQMPPTPLSPTGQSKGPAQSEPWPLPFPLADRGIYPYLPPAEQFEQMVRFTSATEEHIDKWALHDGVYPVPLLRQVLSAQECVHMGLYSQLEHMDRLLGELEKMMRPKFRRNKPRRKDQIHAVDYQATSDLLLRKPHCYKAKLEQFFKASEPVAEFQFSRFDPVIGPQTRGAPPYDYRRCKMSHLRAVRHSWPLPSTSYTALGSYGLGSGNPGQVPNRIMQISQTLVAPPPNEDRERLMSPHTSFRIPLVLLPRSSPLRKRDFPPTSSFAPANPRRESKLPYFANDKPVPKIRKFNSSASQQRGKMTAKSGDISHGAHTVCRWFCRSLHGVVDGINLSLESKGT